MLFSASIFVQTQAQDSTQQTIKKMLDEKHYMFEPTTMTPTSGKLRQLDPGYALQLKGDTLVSYLPYIGRAYSAPMGSSETGYNFTSTNFTYEVSVGKKNTYVVSIKTKDKTYNTDFTLTVYDDGSAYLRASSTDKQPVSYRGHVKQK